MRVVEQPVLGIEAQLVLSVYEGDVHAYVEAVLELALKIQKHRLLTDEPEARLVVPCFDVGRDLDVFIAIGLEENGLGLFKARYDHRVAEVAQRVQEKHLLLRVVSKIEVKGARLALDVFEQQGHRSR